jgi:hypothetical protein
MFRLKSIAIFTEYQYLKTYTELLYSFVTCQWYTVILHGVNKEWQYIGFTTLLQSRRFYYFKMFGCRRFQ